MANHLGVCPGCQHHCTLMKPRCNTGRNIARRRKEELSGKRVASSRFDAERDYSLEMEQLDYGQNNQGYDPEGLADPEAHNTRGPSWDIDWDL